MPSFFSLLSEVEGDQEKDEVLEAVMQYIQHAQTRLRLLEGETTLTQATQTTTPGNYGITARATDRYIPMPANLIPKGRIDTSQGNQSIRQRTGMSPDEAAFGTALLAARLCASIGPSREHLIPGEHVSEELFCQSQ